MVPVFSSQQGGVRLFCSGCISHTQWGSNGREGLAKSDVWRHKLDADVGRVVGTCALVPEVEVPPLNIHGSGLTGFGEVCVRIIQVLYGSSSSSM